MGSLDSSFGNFQFVSLAVEVLSLLCQSLCKMLVVFAENLLQRVFLLILVIFAVKGSFCSHVVMPVYTVLGDFYF